MKVKYIDKRHWRRLLNREYKEVVLDTNHFKGLVGLVTMVQVKEPLKVNVVGKEITVADNGYKWMQILPEKKPYSITVMYDKQNKPVQYYFDVNLRNITQLGNARTLDLCLDVLVIPKSGEYELVDEDDLERMLNEKKISKAQFHRAYVTAHEIMFKLETDFKGMEKRIRYCFHEIMNAK
ncbi:MULTISPECIES: DUF402 domain-containing protein [Mammaliicoccus]|uniref:DUF402 domain-containing protein n=1 Tax=Mammaliicoccus vitulinus TaxID=71237 RepID=A0A2T4PS85_9STAP|nr:DUF402 domain-containing protein [Mammaliicoccus vitulinus]HAL10090.1 DUF402 domain-containing protein [Staphylococcus sp.]MBM6628930.1 DUF402 domain-containing protein [Mammaliicoccus vitulinus]MBO3076008.1 DUF402 domain-containing protein [Mammaliicoccus vitulinus]MEB7658500.1 DUF402 domain-containing protein [Mammaliicoccus vitulinus]PNZ41085.1 DUF402 domain-containing protein [Mammaliicoccus vitulinus]